MTACGIVVSLPLGELPFQITGIPEQHTVEELSARRPDQALHERVGQRHVRHGLDFVDVQNPQVGRSLVRLEQRS
jgi:hypothetical protein